MRREIRCTLMRGGTSKGVFLMRDDLPQDPRLRDQLILGLFGSPDVRQIDGLGGADSLTSKLAIISRSDRSDADVDFTFGAVGITEPFVDYSANCGNISSAVGPYAIEKGMVSPREPYTVVRIYNTNTQRMIHATVPVRDGRVIIEGDFWVDGVPTPGAKITLEFFDPGGPFTGKLLPTGNVRDSMEVQGRNIPMTIIDAGNPTAFVPAVALDLTGVELPDEIHGRGDLLAVLEEIRQRVAQMTGIGVTADGRVSPSVPKVALVSRPASYEGLNQKKVAGRTVHLVSRITAMKKIHRTYPVTGAIPTAAAARIEGSVVHDWTRGLKGKDLRIGHPSGVLGVESRMRKDGTQWVYESCKIGRTARILMDGRAFIPDRVLP